MKQLTLTQLGRLLNISEDTIRPHLYCFEKYRVPRKRPISYFLTVDFLIELKNFYEEKSKAKKYKINYAKYNKSVKKLEKIINFMTTKR